MSYREGDLVTVEKDGYWRLAIIEKIIWHRTFKREHCHVSLESGDEMVVPVRKIIPVPDIDAMCEI